MYELEHARHRKYWESKGDVYLGIWLCRLEHSFLGSQSRSMFIAISRCHIREILFLAWNDSDPNCDLKDRRFQKQFDFVLSPLLPHGDLSETCSDIVRRHFLEPGSDSPSTRLQNDCLTLSGFKKWNILESWMQISEKGERMGYTPGRHVEAFGIFEQRLPAIS